MKEARGEEGGEYKSFEEELYWRKFKSISFCITFSSDWQHKLQIPKKFVDNMRSIILYPKMTIRDPSGVTWEVSLTRVGDALFLKDGWQEFANAYSLQENDVLTFKFDRISTLSVKIFSGQCEKIAAYFVKKHEHVDPALENEKKRALSEIEDAEDGVRGDEVCRATKKPCKNVEFEPQPEPVNHMVRVRRCGTTSKTILSYRKHLKSAINFVRKEATSRSIMWQQRRDSHVQTEPEQHELINLPDNEVLHQNGFEDIALTTKRAETEPPKEHIQNNFNQVE